METAVHDAVQSLLQSVQMFSIPNKEWVMDSLAKGTVTSPRDVASLKDAILFRLSTPDDFEEAFATLDTQAGLPFAAMLELALKLLDDKLSDVLKTPQQSRGNEDRFSYISPQARRALDMVGKSITPRKSIALMDRDKQSSIPTYPKWTNSRPYQTSNVFDLHLNQPLTPHTATFSPLTTLSAYKGTRTNKENTATTATGARGGADVSFAAFSPLVTGALDTPGAGTRSVVKSALKSSAPAAASTRKGNVSFAPQSASRGAAAAAALNASVASSAASTSTASSSTAKAAVLSAAKPRKSTKTDTEVEEFVTGNTKHRVTTTTTTTVVKRATHEPIEAPYATVSTPSPTASTSVVSTGTPAAAAAAPAAPAVADLPLDAQEALIIEDLLYAMMGVEGTYIQVVVDVEGGAANEMKLRVADAIDTSISHLVERMLPLCTAYSRVSAFLEKWSRFEYGVVSHALCSAVRSIVKEYLIFVAQLEHQHRKGALTLQKMWFYVQPSLVTMQLLDSLAAEVLTCEATGGALLNVLHRRLASMGGDQTSHELFMFLMKRASVPYFAMLEAWIYRGIVKDTYSEFVVCEHAEIAKEGNHDELTDSYWEKRYTMRHTVPVFLERVAAKILTTGKYLNVVRQCGRDIVCPFAETLVFTENDRLYVGKIERAYEFASKTLLDVLLSEMQLKERLRSLKHYFLIDQGDVFVHFMDLAAEELAKPIALVSMEKVESLLDMSLRSSSCAGDPFVEHIMCKLSKYNLVEHLLRIINITPENAANASTLSVNTSTGSSVAGSSSGSFEPTAATGMDGFTLNCKVQWPLSIVLNRRALAKYQILQRHLFRCKHVENHLSKAWVQQKAVRRRSVARLFLESQLLRQKMIHFLHNFEYYMLVEVIEPNWHTMEQRLESVGSVDEVLKVHSDFLDTSLKQCMLTSNRLLKLITRLIDACMTFAEFVARFNQHVDDYEDEFSIADLMDAEDYQATVRRAGEQFHTTVTALIDALNNFSHKEDLQMANFCTRLDYNGFYSED